jgi:multicomponent Na+:H+ antiporter subunit D
VGTFLHTGLKLPYGTWFGTAGAGPRTNEGQPLRVGPVPTSMYVAMGIGAALNLAIGVAPQLLYDLLPFPVEYSVYSVGKVVETSQILLFTALASWLLIDKLGATAMISLDADWVYRRLPRVLAELRLRRLRDRRPPVEVAPRESPAPVGSLVHARTVVLERVAGRPYGSPPPVAATWLLGAVVMGAAILFLAATLVTT